MAVAPSPKAKLNPSIATEEAKPAKRSKKIIRIGVALLVLIGVGVGLGLVVVKKMYPAHSKGGKAAAVKEVKEEVHKEPIFVELEPITVNLAAAPETGDSMLQVKVSLEVADKETSAKLASYLPRINSKLLMSYSAETRETWLSKEGKERMAETSLLLVRSALNQKPTDKSLVLAVEFTQLMVQ